ncbi:MAG: hypothetical protein JJ899_12745 [Alphaproteobacteria bacterium]|nr:hypothetical protein [Alphaproteobacteria bacterium]
MRVTVAPQNEVLFDGIAIPAAGWTRTVTAPREPGSHILAVRGAGGELLYEIAFFVLEPSSNIRRGRLDGYRIGNYPADAPAGFIRLDDRGDMDVPVSPHFRIGQFICKQQPGHWPKFLVLSQDLIKRLEVLLVELREDGATDAETLFVMSGFRTPFYNTAIGSAKRSRHMWGDAADVYVDVSPQDGVMDDLNGDGRVSKGDSNWLYDYAEELYAENKTVASGGIGAYSANAVRGPFVHIDGRGSRARWGR